MTAALQTESDVERISASEMKSRFDSHEAITILDARSPNAWAESDVHIVGDTRINPGHFVPEPAWPKTQLTVVYCT